jgi:MFS transporter, NHS family, xanthosine permease
MLSGMAIDAFFTNASGAKDWHSIWLAFAAYALVVAILFVILFKHKHDPEAMEAAVHH